MTSLFLISMVPILPGCASILGALLIPAPFTEEFFIRNPHHYVFGAILSQWRRFGLPPLPSVWVKQMPLSRRLKDSDIGFYNST
jgi:hypothetical protein